MWESSELAEASAGSPESPTARSVLAGVAEVEDVKVYDGIEPAFRGLVDAPGGIVRVSTGTLKPGRRADLTSWLEANGRSVQRVQLVLGYAMGERIIDGRHEMVAISAWPSPLVIEALSEPGGSGGPLFAGAQEFVDDITVEQYQAIGLDLPSRLFDRGARRVLAARFAAREQADAAAAALAGSLSSIADVPASVAPLGAPGTAAEVRSWILVVRVSLADYPRAERLIADHGGEVILATHEEDEEFVTAPQPAEGRPEQADGGPALSVAPAN